MKIGIPKEISAGEKRVAATPETSIWIKKLGFSVVIEAGAGVASSCVDDAYRAEEVEVLEDTRELWADSDIILKVRAPEFHPSLGV
ncbi:MAG: NAD(P)(+) transhydrogenase (Re/Si-specific) subunit alpha, partial [Desulfobacteraceae bacterium]|nr:NAD(P)(+) transhydrogenase (Re/Si-specific) subunit alpha [Desulfobacteraceae bacterium]